MDTNTTTTSPVNAPTTVGSHAMRPRLLAPWNAFAYATSVVAVANVPSTVGVEAGKRGIDLRDSVALQGAPPRENTR